MKWSEKVASYRESDVRQLNTCARARRLRGPVLVDIEPVRGAARDEVVENYVANVARAKVALDHEHLVASVGVHIAIEDILNGSAVRQAANRATARLVAPNWKALSTSINTDVVLKDLLRST